MRTAARWLAGQLEFAAGRVVETDGHPVVRGEWLGAPGAPTILVYGHYDVQPTGDLAEWLTPPFELHADGDVVRGRGVTDDKGPVYIVVKTAQAFLAQEGGLPLNVKFLFEGEEEIGSPHLPAFVRAHAAELAADLVISADGAMWRPTEPSLALASKGLVSMDIIVEGASTDLHSGRYGGTVANPLHALSEILASLHHPDGAVAVRRLLRRHSAAHRGAPPGDRRRSRSTRPGTWPTSGWREAHGEPGFSTLERLWERPTLEINGVRGGGKYTVIPHVAVAHVSCRLVPGQDPDAVIEAIAAHVGAQARAGRARGGPPGRRAGARVHDPGRITRPSGRRPPRWRRSTPASRCCWPASAARCRPPTCSSGCSAPRRCSSRSPPPTRTCTRPNEYLRHPPAARGNAGLGAAVAAARRRAAPAGRRRGPEPPEHRPETGGSMADSAYTAYSYLTAGEDFRSFELAPEFGRVAAVRRRADARSSSSGPAGCCATAW